jgi:hypothetical protein
MNIMIGRPSPTEAAPYYFTYINQVVGENPLATIESQLDESLVFFSTISEEKSKHRYGPDKWSIREVLICLPRSVVCPGLRRPASQLRSGDRRQRRRGRFNFVGGARRRVSPCAACHHFTLQKYACRSVGPHRHRQRQSLHSSSDGIHHCRAPHAPCAYFEGTIFMTTD